MKNSNKLILLSAIVVMFGLSSCDDNLSDEDNFFFGVKLVSSNFIEEIPVGVTTTQIGGDFIVEAPSNGETIEKIDVFVTFKDIVNDGADLSSSERQLLGSIDPSIFTIGTTTFRPEFRYEVSLEEILTATNASINDVDGSDEFNLTFNTAYEGNQAEKAFSIIVVCPSTTVPTPGIWMLDISDSYGDGWDGASLDITINGTTTNYSNINIPGLGVETTTIEINVPMTATSFEVTYNSGNFENEHSYILTSASGKPVIDSGSSPDANPTLDYCAF